MAYRILRGCCRCWCIVEGYDQIVGTCFACSNFVVFHPLFICLFMHAALLCHKTFATRACTSSTHTHSQPHHLQTVTGTFGEKCLRADNVSYEWYMQASRAHWDVSNLFTIYQQLLLLSSKSRESTFKAALAFQFLDYSRLKIRFGKSPEAVAPLSLSLFLLFIIIFGQHFKLFYSFCSCLEKQA